MLTTEEINFLYELLDQVSVRGEKNKLMVLTIMEKLRQMLEVNDESNIS